MTYNADDGVKLLRYLGLRLSETERRIFFDKWRWDYQENKKRKLGDAKNLVETAKTLYSQLPWAMFSNVQAEKVSRIRSKYLDSKITETKIMEKLKDKTLDEVLSQGRPANPHEQTL